MDIIKTIRSFLPAFKGIYHTIREGNNIKVQSIAALCAIAFSAYLKISRIEWCIILLCIALVLSAEIFNTAIELLVDRVTAQKEEWAGKTKDAAAGAVLILAMASLIVGVLIWLPYLC